VAKKAEVVKFVTVEKDGVRLEVHPSTLEAHQAAGWNVVAGAPVDSAPVDESSDAE
jgi:hypothetical protein